jgi:hypothetical protein
LAAAHDAADATVSTSSARSERERAKRLEVRRVRQLEVENTTRTFAATEERRAKQRVHRTASNIRERQTSAILEWSLAGIAAARRFIQDWRAEWDRPIVPYYALPREAPLVTGIRGLRDEDLDVKQMQTIITTRNHSEIRNPAIMEIHHMQTVCYIFHNNIRK